MGRVVGMCEDSPTVHPMWVDLLTGKSGTAMRLRGHWLINGVVVYVADVDARPPPLPTASPLLRAAGAATFPR
jgi:hypothetical protein